ncbi:MAG: N-acetylglucosamine-6-phosphate deacetylase [Betaproteobacteria bacterium]|nr:N-acetylglucosamine-6-phosphate deacetylase [Betaproteobacteria bacterium]
MNFRTGNVLTPGGLVAGRLEIGEDGRVAAVRGAPLAESAARDGSDPLLVPGFIDLHVHGGSGRDIMEGGDAARAVARCHAAGGTTALLATTMTAPPEDIRAAFAALAPVCSERRANEARVIGVHLEGPYINPGKLGAQPDFACPIDLDEVRRLHAQAPIRVVTLAPEMDGHLAAIPALRDLGIRVQLGHSLAGYEDGVKALAQGAAGFTHLFNAMTGLHHRQPGLSGAALAHAAYAEIIPDLLHVHPGAIRVALRAIPGLFCVTDSTAAAGMPDGDYRLGRHTVTKCMGGVRLPDGTLAGSTLTMDQAFRNLVEVLNLDLADASRRVSTHAADFLGLTDRGRLVPGAWADIVVLDRDLKVCEVLVEGRPVRG